jgi:hypothetical protein|tara:strand:- start:95 stop:622 length:528 start_codon:yes stop_codon:yes gene_type:complete
MTVYVLEYEPSPELLSRAMIAWGKPQRSRNEKIRRIVLGVLLYLILVFGVFLLLHYDLVTRSILLGGLVGLLVGVAFWALTYQTSMKKIARFTHEAMARHGVTQTHFSAEKIRLVSQVSETRMDWLCIDEIMSLVAATVLRTGGVVYAVLDSALPHDVTPTRFRSDLQSWLEAAR